MLQGENSTRSNLDLPLSGVCLRMCNNPRTLNRVSEQYLIVSIGAACDHMESTDMLQVAQQAQGT